MRTPVALAALLVTVALLLAGAPAYASDARAALDEANAALSREPPRRDAARAALDRAIAAGDEATAVAEAYFVRGQLDEEDSTFARALADDRAAQAAAPNTRWALRASDRAAWLTARSEGDFAPLSRLEKVRRDPSAASDPGTVEALARDLETFPPGLVRVEARMLVAEAWLGRMHRPAAAIDPLRLVVDDPKTDALTARLAERELVDALIASGQLDGAVAEAHAHSNRLDPQFVREVGRLVGRRVLRHASIATIALFVVLACLTIGRAVARRRLDVVLRELKKVTGVAAVFVAFIAAAGGTLAAKYESGNAAPFYLLGVGVLPLLLVARAWGAVGSQRAAMRAARAVLSAATILAAAFTLLDALNPQYLDGFGL